MAYVPNLPPANPAELPRFVQEESQRLARALTDPLDFLLLRELHAAPTKPRNGMVVLADGSDWDPGSGAGFYGRYGGAWVKLG
jgi:hypothetical protein